MAVEPETRGTVASTATRRRSALPALAWAGIVGPVLFTVAFLAQDALRRGDFAPPDHRATFGLTALGLVLGGLTVVLIAIGH